jgi:predicted phosphodiesterase
MKLATAMRLALLSDIHGNPLALDAVLKDIESQGGVDAHWVLGDVAAIGYDPVGVIERLATLADVRFARGNTDRYVVTGERPLPTVAHVQQDLQLLPVFAEIAESFAWTKGAVSATGWLNWLASFPLEQRLTLPDGTRLLGAHAAPGTDEGNGIHPGLSDDTLRMLLNTCDADLVCVGHTHRPLDRIVDGIRVINLGSISNPVSPDLRASYALLTAATSGYQIQMRYVEYDWRAVLSAIQQSGHTTRAYLTHIWQRHLAQSTQ